MSILDRTSCNIFTEKTLSRILQFVLEKNRYEFDNRKSSELEVNQNSSSYNGSSYHGLPVEYGSKSVIPSQKIYCIRLLLIVAISKRSLLYRY